MSASFILKAGIPIGAALALEHYVLRDKVPLAYQISSVVSQLPRAYGAVILVNVILSSFLMIFLGVKVGKARTLFKEKAAKDGDKDAEARFSYPKMYAEGFSEQAKLFNCIQRGHQHALETYTQFVALSVVGGIKFPLVTSAAGILWIFARIKWAEGYKTGEPSKRYQSWVAYGIWSSLILLAASSIVTAFMIMQ